MNITGGEDMTLFEVDEAATRVTAEVDDETANIIFGSTYDSGLNGIMRVSVVATGKKNRVAEWVRTLFFLFFFCRPTRILHRVALTKDSGVPSRMACATASPDTRRARGVDRLSCAVGGSQYAGLSFLTSSVDAGRL